MEIKEFLKEKTVLLDGGMGTLLQAKGLKSGELPEEWNITHPDVLTSIHLEYLNAGSDVITANTFGANSLKFNDEKLEEIIRLAIETALLSSTWKSGNSLRASSLAEYTEAPASETIAY